MTYEKWQRNGAGGNKWNLWGQECPYLLIIFMVTQEKKDTKKTDSWKEMHECSDHAPVYCSVWSMDSSWHWQVLVFCKTTVLCTVSKMAICNPTKLHAMCFSNLGIQSVSPLRWLCDLLWPMKYGWDVTLSFPLRNLTASSSWLRHQQSRLSYGL